MQEEDIDEDAEATLVVDWNRVAADANYQETIVLAAEAQAIVDKERADEVSIQPPLGPSSTSLYKLAKRDFCRAMKTLSSCLAQSLSSCRQSLLPYKSLDTLMQLYRRLLISCSHATVTHGQGPCAQMRRKGIDPNAPPDEAGGANSGRATIGHRCVTTHVQANIFSYVHILRHFTMTTCSVPSCFPYLR
jgi:hypothetical protein